MSKSNMLTTSIINLLILSGATARRVNTMGVVRNGRYTKSGMRKGFEDINATIPLTMPNGCKIGVTVAIEVKIGKDKQSKEQITRQKELEETGGIYIVAKDIEQFACDIQKRLIEKIEGTSIKCMLIKKFNPYKPKTTTKKPR